MNELPLAAKQLIEHRHLACVPSGDSLRCDDLFSGFQIRSAHRLKVYVPLASQWQNKRGGNGRDWWIGRSAGDAENFAATPPG